MISRSVKKIVNAISKLYFVPLSSNLDYVVQFGFQITEIIQECKSRYKEDYRRWQTVSMIFLVNLKGEAAGFPLTKEMYRKRETVSRYVRCGRDLIWRFGKILVDGRLIGQDEKL